MRNLFYFLVGVLMALCASIAMAAAPITSTWYWVGSSGEFSSQSAACADYYGKYTIPNSNYRKDGYEVGQYSSSDARAACIIYEVLVSNGSRSVSVKAVFQSASRTKCADGSAPNTSLPSAQQCADPAPLCTPGKQYSVVVSAGKVIPGTVNTTDMKYPTNIGGCRVYVGGIDHCDVLDSTGDVFCSFRVTEGGQATAGESPTSTSTKPSGTRPTEVPPHNPAQGQGCPKGTVNLGTDSTGGSICGGSGTSPSSPTKTEVKQPATTVNNPDGGTTKTEVSTRTNSDGSTTTTTKTTTTGPDGKVTTSESSVTGNKPTSAGGGAGKDDSSDGKDDFCKKNPQLNACKNSTVAGECENTSCEGDAIQCAILRQQRKQYCESNKDNDQSNLAKAALAGNDPIGGTLPTKQNATTINFQNMNQNSFLGTASCWPDKTISIMGVSVTLPLSKPCEHIAWLRFVMMTIAALVSFKILRGPILGS
ncbi:hypothetical protein [uncultured Oxalicibacterium sp.]|uniref:hypothetical protein n=1 Tax=uncultured Oxalicibacterium sp. TaxID=1168540 RepID=UPI0025D63EAF|nr:hypothetical protein [uncultured Oxalicibacterium sp.]